MDLKTDVRLQGWEAGAGALDLAPDELTCAICLSQPEPVDMAIIKGCEHVYCGGFVGSACMDKG